VKQTCEQHFNDFCLVYLLQLSDTSSSLSLRYLIKSKKETWLYSFFMTLITELLIYCTVYNERGILSSRIGNMWPWPDGRYIPVLTYKQWEGWSIPIKSFDLLAKNRMWNFLEITSIVQQNLFFGVRLRHIYYHKLHVGWNEVSFPTGNTNL
jgi:hypothetical protein